MKRFLPWIGVFLVGLVLGISGIRLLESVGTDSAILAQRSEFIALEKRLRAQEEQLASSRSELRENQRSLSMRLTAALQLADQVGGSQKATLERLRTVIATLRTIISELPEPGAN